MRIALVSLIALAQVAGPWLCCCAAAQVSAAFAGKLPAKPVAVAPVQPNQPKTAACPHCQKGDAQPKSPAEPTPASPLPDQCPCGGYELVAVSTERKATSDEPAVFVAELPARLAHFPSALSPAEVKHPGLRELPWLTASDRLFAHHVLRC